MVKLLLTSAGVANQPIANELRRLVGQPTKAASIVVILAATTSPHEGSRLLRDLRRLHSLGWRHFGLADIAALPSRSAMRQLRRAQVIYFAPGSAYQLAHTLEAKGPSRELIELSGTTVLAGAGAASMVFCEQMSERLAKLCGTDALIHPTRRHAVSPLNLVPWFVLPQVDFDAWDPRCVEPVGFPVFAIDNETAIAVTDDEVVVAGQGRWRFLPGLP